MVKKDSKNRIVLLDAHAIIHRAYHALPDFVSSKGEPTGALYGVANMLIKIATDLKPDHIIACYDLPKPTFRHVAYEAYKAGRQKADDNLVTQFSTSREIFEAFSVPVIEYPGFEADDIIGTLADALKQDANNEVIIASGDMDTMQLIDKNRVVVYTLKKGLNDTIIYNEKAVVERFSFSPKQIADYKGLAGDTSDNIPGIKGIGPKTATNIITTFGSVEKMYKELKKKNSTFDFPGCTPRIKNLIEEGEEDAIFSKTLATIRCDAPVEYVIESSTWRERLNLDTVNTVLTRFDFRSLKERVAALKEGRVVEIKKETKTTKKETKQERMVDKDLFKRLQLMAWILSADRTNPTESDICDIAGCATLEEAEGVLEQKIRDDKVLSRLFSDLESPLMVVTKHMQDVGVSLDTKYLERLQKVYEEDLAKLTKKIHILAGREFNISSPKQLGEVLFDDLALATKGIKKTSTGAKSTNIDTLEKLRGEHEIIEYIIEYRELEKTLNTYIVPLPKLMHADGRVHSDFIQTGAATGRFSSVDPNMQNLPVTNEEGKNIRRAFVSEKGKVFLAFDYSQIELRIAAMLSGDETLVDTFVRGEDVHTRVAMRVFGVEENGVTPTMRRHAKTVNFGILYGMGVTALKDGLGTDRKEAQEFYDTYKESFGTLMQYLEGVKASAKAKGYTETLYGRRRPIPLLRSPLLFLRAQGERMAINAPIQGTDADIVRCAMVDIYNKLKEEKLLGVANIILQIHDEVVLEVDESIKDTVIDIVLPCMQNILTTWQDFEVMKVVHVPLVVSVKEGTTLGDLHTL